VRTLINRFPPHCRASRNRAAWRRLQSPIPAPSRQRHARARTWLNRAERIPGRRQTQAARAQADGTQTRNRRKPARRSDRANGRRCEGRTTSANPTAKRGATHDAKRMANERKRGRKMTRGDNEKRFAAMPESALAGKNLRRGIETRNAQGGRGAVWVPCGRKMALRWGGDVLVFFSVSMQLAPGFCCSRIENGCRGQVGDTICTAQPGYCMDVQWSDFTRHGPILALESRRRRVAGTAGVEVGEVDCVRGRDPIRHPGGAAPPDCPVIPEQHRARGHLSARLRRSDPTCPDASHERHCAARAKAPASLLPGWSAIIKVRPAILN
jgi:hypothetical protein